jgi:ankyrin repeat protein
LNGSGLNLTAVVHRVSWPSEELLRAADAVVIYSDGNRDHPALGREADLDQLADRGAGIVILHYALDGMPGALDETLLAVVGGVYEDNTSYNPLWTLKDPMLARHAVTRGVKPFELKDEWYYNLKFGDITPLLQAVPPEEEQAYTLAWIFGRNAFGFTGGHYHHNWGNADYRKLVLNGIVWSAGLEVPADGVPSTDPVVVRTESILHAIAMGDAEDVRNHLLLGADVNQKNRQGWTPLHFAAVRGQAGCAEVLIDNGAALDVRTGTLKTPLHFAADRGYLEITKHLVENGADIMARDDEQWSPLHFAAEKDRVEIAAYLIAEGAVVDARSKRGGTPLHEASASAGPEMIRLLLKSGADKNIEAANGKTPLDYAIELDNGPARELLE